MQAFATKASAQIDKMGLGDDFAYIATAAVRAVMVRDNPLLGAEHSAKAIYALAGFDKLPARIEVATTRYNQVARDLGDWFPEQQFIRHPAHKLLSWLKSFVPSERQR